MSTSENLKTCLFFYLVGDLLINLSEIDIFAINLLSRRYACRPEKMQMDE